MRRRPSGKAILWGVLAIPAVVTVVRLIVQPDTALEELLHPTGEWSARLMILALMFTPLAILFTGSRSIHWLVRNRRAFGVGAFCYALAHLVVYVLDVGTVARMLAEVGRLGIWTGWVALLLLVPVGLTSNQAATRALGRGWKRLQRLAYPAALFALLHWAFIHESPVAALANFAPLILLQLARIVVMIRRGAGAKPSTVSPAP